MGRRLILALYCPFPFELLNACGPFSEGEPPVISGEADPTRRLYGMNECECDLDSEEKEDVCVG